QHKNLVRFGELSCEDGQWFFSMELVRGKSFLEYVRPLEGNGVRPPTTKDAATEIARRLIPDSGIVEKAKSSAPPPAAEIGYDEARLRSVLAQLVSALAAIHDAGHVHRDVKPSNVLVTEEGRVVLLDFGLVTALADRADPGEEGWVLGTPLYMAPEQIAGGA